MSPSPLRVATQVAAIVPSCASVRLRPVLLAQLEIGRPPLAAWHLEPVEVEPPMEQVAMSLRAPPPTPRQGSEP